MKEKISRAGRQEKFTIPRRPGFALPLKLNRLHSSQQLFTSQRPGYFQLQPAAKISTSPSVWLGEGDLQHYKQHTHRLAPVRLLVQPEATLFACGVIGTPRRKLLHPKDRYGDEVLNAAHIDNQRTGSFSHASNRRSITLSQELQARRVSEPAFVLVQCGFRSYGHWLLDVLPKIVLWWSLPERTRLVVPGPMPAWQKEFFRLLGIGRRELIAFDPARHFLQLDRAIIPTQLRNIYALNPMANIVYESLAATAVNPQSLPADPTGQSTRLYVSRRLSRTKRCLMVNEEEVIRILVKRGFKVIEPETLPVSEQINAFANARIVVGEAGSALHNTLFAPRGTRVLSLQSEAWPRFAQAGIGHIRSQPTGFVFGTHSTRHDHAANGRPFTVDIAMLENALKTLL